MARDYEMVVVLHSDLTEEEVPDRLSHLATLVSEHGGTVAESIDWGRRRLAYPIKGNFEGHYLINIDESVLRYLIIRKDD